MSIEIFNTLQASVSGTTVTLTWTKNDPGFPPVTAYAVQRKLFGRGDDNWSTLSSGISPASSNSYTDAIGAVGDWAYRIVATVTQGGVDAAGTSIYSNQVNVTTESTTGEVSLSVGSRAASGAGGGLPNYTEVVLSWNIAGTAVDVKFWEIQRSLGSGPYRSVAEIDEFEQEGVCTWSENLPNGTGTVNYKVVAHLPSATPPYQADVLSTSGVGSVTI